MCFDKIAIDICEMICESEFFSDSKSDFSVMSANLYSLVQYWYYSLNKSVKSRSLNRYMVDVRLKKHSSFKKWNPSFFLRQFSLRLHTFPYAEQVIYYVFVRPLKIFNATSFFATALYTGAIEWVIKSVRIANLLVEYFDMTHFWSELWTAPWRVRLHYVFSAYLWDVLFLNLLLINGGKIDRYVERRIYYFKLTNAWCVGRTLQ